ncbi:MAG: hypothetical protein AVDCRST_MAG50-1238 [uncultured Acidimicrobiales bacterium]|uniref:ABC transporter, fused permease protein n=1 Tax=uncultured Acidimicrobiales bacterium TaxID=310071 RepID=A0A6J4HVF9_9ACTN|nr:MAG: hypothetical protein AVDCRST_MAG50-1238 [uncultured Acidimicrobiales bacterium]
MFRTTITAAWARKRRLVGTALAVVLGVAFLTATLAIGDSARAGFETVFTEANAGTDALVRSAHRIEGVEGAAATPLDASVVAVVAGVDGVASAVPVVEAVARLVGSDGVPLGGGGPPTIGTSWSEDPAVNPYRLVEGRAPAAAGEVVIDRDSAEAGQLAVGSSSTVLTPSPAPVTVVGIATFGDRGTFGGVTLAAFAFDHAQDLLLGSRSLITGVVVRADQGVDEAELVERLTALLPAGAEAVSGTDLTAEQQAAIEGYFLGFMETGLLLFAGIALLVAAFSIFNTFSILAAQRTRESALLRTLGASRVQVLAAGVAETAVIGLGGSLLGVGAGMLVGIGLLAVMEAAGAGLPTDGLRVTGSTVAVSVGVGVAVTLVGGLVPAWRASRVAPLAALREVSVDTSGASRLRLAFGAVLALAGVALVLSGTGEAAMSRAGLGALALLFGVLLLGPAAAGPVGSALGAPLLARGVAGDLARRNAVRNPRRTAASAAALLVGVGVVTLFAVFGSSISASIEDAVDRSFAGDLVLQSAGFSGAGLSPELLSEIRAVPDVEAAAGLGFGAVVLDGEERQVGFSDLAELTRVADFHVLHGDIGSVRAGGVGISGDTAEEKGWQIGQQVDVRFSDGVTEKVTVEAIYDDRGMGGDVLLPVDTWVAHVAQPAFALVFVGLVDGASVEDGRAAVASVAERHGSPEVRDRDQFVENEAAGVDSLLNVVYGLLGLAILIALMGIANTLSLSIHERTRELGLLRAIGLNRSQLRTMVRWESVIVSTFGAVGGIAIGVFLGWGMVRALAAAEGFGTFRLPAGSLVVVLLLGSGVGVVAGLRPAWRAARMDVLAAVTAD